MLTTTRKRKYSNNMTGIRTRMLSVFENKNKQQKTTTDSKYTPRRRWWSEDQEPTEHQSRPLCQDALPSRRLPSRASDN